MRIEDLLIGQDSINATNELINILKSEENAAVFLGAGVSKNSGYGTWDEVVNGTPERKGLLSLIQNDDSLSQLSDSEIAERCFQENIDGYRNFLLEEFGDKANYTFNSLILELRDMGFKGFITTNFDKCLYSNIPRATMFSFPFIEEDFSQIPFITYLHGRVFGTHDDDPEKINKLLDSVVFRSAMYNMAYSFDEGGSGVCSAYLARLCKEMHIVFIGFSFKDHYVFDSLMKSLRNRKTLDIERERVHSRYKSTWKNIYIFTEEEKGIYADRDLRKYDNIKFIRYKSLDSHFRGLNELMHQIYIKLNDGNYKGNPFIDTQDQL